MCVSKHEERESITIAAQANWKGPEGRPARKHSTCRFQTAAAAAAKDEEIAHPIH